MYHDLIPDYFVNSDYFETDELYMYIGIKINILYNFLNYF
jgi:hypothetical protein